MDKNLIVPNILTKIFRKKIIPIPWKWTTECFKTTCGHNLLIEVKFFKKWKYSAHMHNFNISICYKSRVFCLPTINVTFLILHHFPVVVFPLCLPSSPSLSSAVIRAQRVEEVEELRPWQHPVVHFVLEWNFKRFFQYIFNQTTISPQTLFVGTYRLHRC